MEKIRHRANFQKRAIRQLPALVGIAGRKRLRAASLAIKMNLVNQLQLELSSHWRWQLARSCSLASVTMTNIDNDLLVVESENIGLCEGASCSSESFTVAPINHGEEGKEGEDGQVGDHGNLRKRL